MTFSSPISPDWTTVVPEAVLEALGVERGEELVWVVEGERVELRAQETVVVGA